MLARTSLINQLRAVLLERGRVHPKNRLVLMRRLREIGMDGLIADPCNKASVPDERIRAYDEEFVALTRTDERARRLASIPGVGMINAIALLAAVGDASAFAKARDLAAWLGLPPRQHSTDGRTKIAEHQQAREPLSAQAAHPCGRQADTARDLVARSARACLLKCRRDGTRCQAGPHSVGATAPKTSFRSGGARDGLIAHQQRPTLPALTQSAEGTDRGHNGRTSVVVVLVVNAVLDTAGFMKTRGVQISNLSRTRS